MRTAAVVSDEKIAALQHGTYLTERRATDDNGLAAQEFRKLASFFPFVVRANDHRLHSTLLPQSRQALRIIFQWPSAAGATAADTDGDHRTRGGYVRQQLRRELTVPVGETDLQLAVVHLPAQGFYDFKIAQHFVLHRTPRKADVKCRVESAIVPLLGRRRRLRIAHPFRGIHQRAQKCREPVIDIPPRRDGNVEAPASQSAPIQQQDGQQSSQPRRQPRSLQRAQTDDLVNVRVGYQKRAEGILHYHRAKRSGKGALQLPEERRCQDQVAQPIEPDDKQREPLATGRSDPSCGRQVGAPEDRQLGGYTDGQEQRRQHRSFPTYDSNHDGGRGRPRWKFRRGLRDQPCRADSLDQRYEFDASSPGPHFAGPHDSLFAVVATFYQHVRTNRLDQFQGRAFVEDDHGVHCADRGKNPRALMFAHDGPQRSLDQAHRLIAVECDNQAIALAARPLQQSLS